MKRKYILFVITLLISVCVSAQSGEMSVQAHVTPLELKQKGDSVYVKLNIDVSDVKVRPQRSISIIPTLMTPVDKLYLPAVDVKGRINHNVYYRRLALMSKKQRADHEKTAPYAVLRGFKSKSDKTVEYNVAVKYEPWMAYASLDIYEDLCGCGNPPRRTGSTMLAKHVNVERDFTPYLSYIQPAVESVKRREISGEAFLDFVVNKIDIRPEYMNNPRELKKISDLIAEVSNDKDITVRAINVIGFASPEGTIWGNRKLSEGRAKALAGYLAPRFEYPKELYKIVYGGENWVGLRRMLVSSDVEYKDQMLAILDDKSISDEQRKVALKSLKGGVPYRYILKEWYPSLRTAICTIDFEIKNFDAVEAAEVIKTHPENLSLNEIFVVAGSYEKGSKEFIGIIETAVRLYPDDVTANLNAATAALLAKDMDSAEKYLNRIEGKTSLPEYYNAKGVLLMLRNEYAKAEELLQKAASMGLAEADSNLKQLNER